MRSEQLLPLTHSLPSLSLFLPFRHFHHAPLSECMQSMPRERSFLPVGKERAWSLMVSGCFFFSRCLILEMFPMREPCCPGVPVAVARSTTSTRRRTLRTGDNQGHKGAQAQASEVWHPGHAVVRDGDGQYQRQQSNYEFCSTRATYLPNMHLNISNRRTVFAGRSVQLGGSGIVHTQSFELSWRRS